MDLLLQIEKIINKGSDQANRCVEIAMGSPLTEKEINATKKINKMSLNILLII